MTRDGSGELWKTLWDPTMIALWVRPSVGLLYMILKLGRILTQTVREAVELFVIARQIQQADKRRLELRIQVEDQQNMISMLKVNKRRCINNEDEEYVKSIFKNQEADQQKEVSDEIGKSVQTLGDCTFKTDYGLRN